LSQKNLKNSIGYKDGKGGDISNDNMSQEDKVRKLHKDLLLNKKNLEYNQVNGKHFLELLNTTVSILQTLIPLKT
jgi:hypothetical protein